MQKTQTKKGIPFYHVVHFIIIIITLLAGSFIVSSANNAFANIVGMLTIALLPSYFLVRLIIIGKQPYQTMKYWNGLVFSLGIIATALLSTSSADIAVHIFSISNNAQFQLQLAGFFITNALAALIWAISFFTVKSLLKPT